MNSLISRAIKAWQAWKSERELKRQSKVFDRNNPHIVAKRREIERKRRRHQPTLVDTLELRRMTSAALRGDA